jgi:hypothetical protein
MVDVVAQKLEATMNTYKVGAAILAAAVSILIAGHAQAAPTGTSSAVLCKTESGIESLFAFHEANPQASMLEGVTAVNAIEASANCRILSFVYEVGEIVATVRLDGQGVDVRRVSVLAECGDQRCDNSHSEAGYSAFPLTPTI